MATRTQRRGDERRELLLRATLELVSERGIGAVTHRAVAARSDVPLGSLTYYFPQKADLLRGALLLLVEEQVARLHALAPAPGAPAQEIAALAADELSRGEDGDLAQFELYLEAARDPSLREATARSLSTFDGVATQLLAGLGVPRPEHLAPLFVAVADGLALRRLAAPELALPRDLAFVTLLRAVGAEVPSAAPT